MLEAVGELVISVAERRSVQRVCAEPAESLDSVGEPARLAGAGPAAATQSE